MPNLKDIKRRIDSVKKTRQITSAMKLVAGAKLRKATERAFAARPYRDKLEATLSRVAANAGEAVDPLLAAPKEVKRIRVVVLTSDRGLCGSFNNAMLRRTHLWLEDRKLEGVDVQLKVFGRKGVDFLKARGFDTSEAVIHYAKTPKMDLVRPICDESVVEFLDGEKDEVWLFFNQFKSAIAQVPTFQRILPMEVAVPDDPDSLGMAEFEYEPGPVDVLRALLPLYLRTVVLQAFFENEAGEHAARMTAMDNATRNASDLIDALTLQFNRARQAAITTEITEIVSGAEAL